MRREKIVVSLTTFPERILCAAKVVKLMLGQSVKPDKVVLCLATDQFPDHVLPEEITDIKDKSFSIIWGEDLKPHKKYYYAMLENPDAIVITVDDDIYYPKDLIKRLLKSYKKFPEAVSCLRGHTIKMLDKTTFSEYREWHDHKKIVGEPSMLMMPTGVGGVLYPPHIFPKEFFDIKAIRETCLMTDDLWLKWWQIVNNVPCVLAQENFDLAYIEQSQEHSLWKTNLNKNKNDENWKNITSFYSKQYPKRYKELCKKLYDEYFERFSLPRLKYLADLKKNKISGNVKISVIMPVYNAELYLRQAIDSVLNQTLYELELILVDDGSTDSSLKIIKSYINADPRVKLVRQKNSFAGVARNNGFLQATGDYVYFMDSDDWLDENAFETLYPLVEKSREDMCIFFHYDYNNVTGESVQVPKYYHGDKTPGAVFVTDFSHDSNHFIYNTVVPWNKIYRREFIKENGFKWSSLPAANDRSFYFKTITKAKRIKIVNAYFLHYRRNNDSSISSIGRLKKFYVHFRSMEEILGGNKDMPYREYLKLIDVCMKDIFGFFARAYGSLRIDIWKQMEEYFSTLDIPYSEDGKIDKYFYWYKDYKAIKSPLFPDEQVIISVSADKNTIKFAYRSVESLLMQSLHAEKVVLWLAEDQFTGDNSDLPEELTCLIGDNFEIKYCPTQSCYYKYYRIDYPEAVLIVADGDVVYEHDMAKRLYLSYLSDKRSVHALLISKAYVWGNEVNAFIRGQYVSGASALNKPLTAGGVVYPPECFHEDAFDFGKYVNFSDNDPQNWFWCMSDMNSHITRQVEGGIDKIRYTFGNSTLIDDVYEHDSAECQNANILARQYPEWNRRLNSEITERDAKVQFAGYMQEQFALMRKNLFKIKQSFEKDFAVITDADFLEQDEKSLAADLPADQMKSLKTWLLKTYGTEINIAHPSTYTDKMQIKKVSFISKRERSLADKYEARKIIENRIGEKHLSQFIGVYDSFDDIKINELPEDITFTCTHGGNQEFAVKDINKIDISALQEKINTWLHTDYAANNALELQYANIKPRIMVEKTVIPADGIYYKILCFGGRAKYIVVEKNLGGKLRRTVFDCAWNKQSFTIGCPEIEGIPDRPKELEKLVFLAEKCVEGIDHVRIDFCISEDGNVVYKGLTFTPWQGVGRFTPKIYDNVIGRELTL